MLPAQARRQCENFFIDNGGCFLRVRRIHPCHLLMEVSPCRFSLQSDFLSLFHDCSRQESAEFRVVGENNCYTLED